LSDYVRQIDTPTFKLLKELCLGRTPLFYLEIIIYQKNLKENYGGNQGSENEIALAIVKLLESNSFYSIHDDDDVIHH
jgi:hypothetical protein